MKRKIVISLVLFIVVVLGKFTVWPEIKYQYHVNILKLAPVGSQETHRFQCEVDRIRRLRNKENYQLEKLLDQLQAEGKYLDEDAMQKLNHSIASLERDIVELDDEYQDRIRQAPGLYGGYKADDVETGSSTTFDSF